MGEKIQSNLYPFLPNNFHKKAKETMENRKEKMEQL